MENVVAIKSHMTRFPVVASREMRLEDARAIMSKFGIRHLPVVQDGQIVGTISERDILRAGEAIYAGWTVADAMQHDVFVAAPEAPLAEIAKIMHEKKFGSAVIVDRSLNVTGIFTTTDAMRLLADLLSRTSAKAEPDPDLTVGEFFEWDAGWGEAFLGNRECSDVGRSGPP